MSKQKHTKPSKPETTKPAQTVTVADSNIGAVNTGQIDRIASAVGAVEDAADEPLDLSKLGSVLERMTTTLKEHAAETFGTVKDLAEDLLEPLTDGVESSKSEPPPDPVVLAAEPSTAIHDPTPVSSVAAPMPQPSVTCSFTLTPGEETHSVVRHIAALAFAGGFASLELRVDGETLRRLRAELGPEGAEVASHRWGNNQIRLQTALGWVWVQGPP